MIMIKQEQHNLPPNETLSGQAVGNNPRGREAPVIDATLPEYAVRVGDD
jgi:hypothetical protein